jgi:TonB-dependent siderophore receptor
MIRRGALAAALLAGCLAGLPAVAQTEGDKKEQEEESRETKESRDEDTMPVQREYIEVNVSKIPQSNTVVSKLPLSQQMTPANVGSVTETLIMEQDGYVLSDALRNVSSVNVQTQNGVHDYFLIRGFDSVNGSMIMFDGAIEPEASWYPTYNMVGVEVLKGPAGFLYGVDPLAGAVNMVRKQPLPTSFADFRLSLGSFQTAEGTVDWNQSFAGGKKNFRLNALAFGTDNYRDIDESEQYAINPSFTWQTSDDSQLTFNLELVRADFQPDAGLPLVDGSLPAVPREQSYRTPFDFSEQDVARFQVDYQNKLSEKLTLRNKFYVRDLNWDTQGTQLLGTVPVPDSRVVLRTLTSLDDDQQYVGNQFEGVWKLTTGSVTHNLLTGVELRYFSDTYDIGFVPPVDPATPQVPGIPAIDLYDPIETATPVSPLPFLGGESDSWDLAPYVTDQMVFSKKFEVLLGARYDVIRRDDLRIDYTPALAGFPPTVEDISRDDSTLSPMLGLVYAPTPTVSLYANASRSYAPAGVRVFGELDPERSTGYELGLKKKLIGDKLRTTIAVYEIERDNLAIPDDNGVTQQAGDQRSRGFEIEFAAEPARGLTAFLAYAYTDAELTNFTERIGLPGSQVTIDRTGNTPAFVPENLLNFWVSKRFRCGFGVGGGARFIDEQFISEANDVTINSALVLNATAFYDFPAFRVSVNVKNLTDEEYELRGFGSNAVIPAMPAAVYFGFQYRM